MTAVSIIAPMRRARSADTTEWPVAGFLPPFARKRPANASCRQLIAMAQWWK